MYDLVVLGSDPGGLSVATAAARIGAKVALVRNSHGSGSSVHSRSIPTRVLLRAARVAHLVRISDRFGVRTAPAEIDFAAVMARARNVSAELAARESDEVHRAQWIDVFRGAARFAAYDTLLVDGKTRVEGERFVLASGSRPAVPPIPGLADVGYLTDASVWELTERPDALVIVGAGPQALELAQGFARLGIHVKLLTETDRILPDEDRDVNDRLESLLTSEGIVIKTGAEFTGAFLRSGRKVVAFRDRTTHDTFEAAGTDILVATARLANVEDLGLDVLGINADPANGIAVDEYLQTPAPRVYAVGDTVRRGSTTHAAEREAAIVFHNAVLRIPRKLDHATLPRGTFTDPEVAAVGLTEAAAQEQHPDSLVFRAEYAELDRAWIDGRVEGFAKLIVSPSGRILGASAVGADASTVIQEFVTAIEHGLTVAALARTARLNATYAGMAHLIARKASEGGLDRGFVQSAVKWVLGYRPRTRSGADSSPRA